MWVSCLTTGGNGGAPRGICVNAFIDIGDCRYSACVKVVCGSCVVVSGSDYFIGVRELNSMFRCVGCMFSIRVEGYIGLFND